MEKKIFAFVGPSGSGKTTLIRHLTSQMDELKEAVSITTRKPRIGEIEGVDYYYVTQDCYDSTPMYEKTYYAGNYYGLSKKEIDGILQNKNVIVAVDINGLHILENEFGKENVISIFVYAPVRMLIDRMYHRGDSNEKIQKRLDNIEKTSEFGNIQYCDYICQNILPIEEGSVLRSLEGVIQKVLKNQKESITK